MRLHPACGAQSQKAPPISAFVLRQLTEELLLGVIAYAGTNIRGHNSLRHGMVHSL